MIPSTESSETATLRRGIRVDLIIAVCALLMSSLATGASWWQSRVIAQQLSAQVWPFLSISTTYSHDYFRLDVSNDGLGPAIVRSAVITVDGKPYPDPVRALAHVVPTVKGKTLNGAFSSLSPGSVIRVGGVVQLFRVTTPWIVPAMAKAAPRFDVTICYCSLLGNCWVTSAQRAGDPTGVARCPDAGADQLTVRPMIAR